MELKEKLLNFVIDDLFGDGTEVDADDNLLADGMIDSIGMLRLAAFIEESEGIKIAPGDFTIENFRTINIINQYISGLKTASNG